MNQQSIKEIILCKIIVSISFLSCVIWVYFLEIPVMSHQVEMIISKLKCNIFNNSMLLKVLEL